MIINCRYCSEDFTTDDARRKFCSRSCAAKLNNSKSPKRKKLVRYCQSADCDLEVMGKRKKCAEHSRYRHPDIDAWLAGDNSVTLNKGRNQQVKHFVKRHLVLIRGDRCEQCGWDTKAPDGRSIIQMDHIDGNSQNNLIENLRLLCPNHHAMTPTYGFLNKNSARAYRRREREN